MPTPISLFSMVDPCSGFSQFIDSTGKPNLSNPTNYPLNEYTFTWIKTLAEGCSNALYNLYTLSQSILNFPTNFAVYPLKRKRGDDDDPEGNKHPKKVRFNEITIVNTFKKRPGSPSIERIGPSKKPRIEADSKKNDVKMALIAEEAYQKNCSNEEVQKYLDIAKQILSLRNKFKEMDVQYAEMEDFQNKGSLTEAQTEKISKLSRLMTDLEDSLLTLEDQLPEFVLSICNSDEKTRPDFSSPDDMNIESSSDDEEMLGVETEVSDSLASTKQRKLSLVLKNGNNPQLLISMILQGDFSFEDLCAIANSLLESEHLDSFEWVLKQILQQVESPSQEVLTLLKNIYQKISELPDYLIQLFQNVILYLEQKKYIEQLISGDKFEDLDALFEMLGFQFFNNLKIKLLKHLVKINNIKLLIKYLNQFKGLVDGSLYDLTVLAIAKGSSDMIGFFLNQLAQRKNITNVQIQQLFKNALKNSNADLFYSLLNIFKNEIKQTEGFSSYILALLCKSKNGFEFDIKVFKPFKFKLKDLIKIIWFLATSKKHEMLFNLINGLKLDSILSKHILIALFIKVIRVGDFELLKKLVERFSESRFLTLNFKNYALNQLKKADKAHFKEVLEIFKMNEEDYSIVDENFLTVILTDPTVKSDEDISALKVLVDMFIETQPKLFENLSVKLKTPTPPILLLAKKKMWDLVLKLLKSMDKKNSYQILGGISNYLKLRELAKNEKAEEVLECLKLFVTNIQL